MITGASLAKTRIKVPETIRIKLNDGEIIDVIQEESNERGKSI